jgi:hypothetical protein
MLWWAATLVQPSLTRATVGDLVLGTALSLVAVLVVGALHGDVRLPRRGRSGQAPVRTLLAVIGLASLTWVGVAAPAAPAQAHDPGQGAELSEGSLTVTHSGSEARVRLALQGSCDGLSAAGTVARRAGQEHRGSLSLQSGTSCTATGSAPVDDAGRWFVYAELTTRDGHPVETWLPVSPGETVEEVRSLYHPPTGEDDVLVRNVTGVVLLVVVLGLLTAALRLSRAIARSAADQGIGARA